MTKLSARKTRLTFETEHTIRYRRLDRPIVVEPDMDGFSVYLRLKGTRARFGVSWRSVYELAAKVAADRLRADRKAARRKGGRA
jgi:hypothetical protein